MDRIFRLVAIALTLITLMLGALSVHAIATLPVPTWTSISIAAFFILLVIGIAALWREPHSIFAPTLALFGTLVIGRLFSTLRFEGAGGVSLSSLDPLLVAETGPGVPTIMYTSVALFAVLVLHLLLVARRGVARGGSQDVSSSPADWALAFLRIYVGMMFIAHFAGHLFGGPIPFAVFADYFASIHLPYPAAFVILAGLIELAVTIGLAFGFMTRIAAVGAVVYLFVSVGLGGHFGVGYVWVLPTGGWEFPALWMFAASLFAVIGGGPLSVDAWLKRQFARLPTGLRYAIT